MTAELSSRTSCRSRLVCDQRRTRASLTGFYHAPDERCRPSLRRVRQLALSAARRPARLSVERPPSSGYQPLDVSFCSEARAFEFNSRSQAGRAYSLYEPEFSGDKAL